MKTSLKVNLAIVALVSFTVGILLGLHLNYKLDPFSGTKFAPVDPGTFKAILESQGTSDLVAIYF